MKTTKEMIEVMQASLDGKQIQSTSRFSYSEWIDVDNPNWDWKILDYRIKPEEKKPTYRPYNNIDEMIQDFKHRFSTARYPDHAMPLIWVKEKGNKTSLGILISEFRLTSVLIGCAECECYFDELLNDFTYLDGSPCGKKVE